MSNPTDESLHAAKVRERVDSLMQLLGLSPTPQTDLALLNIEKAVSKFIDDLGEARHHVRTVAGERDAALQVATVAQDERDQARYERDALKAREEDRASAVSVVADPAKPQPAESIERAREAVRLAELELMRAMSANVQRVAWIVLNDAIAPVRVLSNRLTHLAAMVEEEGK